MLSVSSYQWPTEVDEPRQQEAPVTTTESLVTLDMRATNTFHTINDDS